MRLRMEMLRLPGKQLPPNVRIIDEVKKGTCTYSSSKTSKKGIVDSQADVGGWPELKSLSLQKILMATAFLMNEN